MDKRTYKFYYLHNDESAKFFTYLVIVFNIIYAILGAMMLTAAFYISLDENFRQYVSDLDFNQYMPGVYILMIAGALVMVQSFFGICGAYLKKSAMLMIFFVMLVICFILEVAGASYLLANGTSGSKMDVWFQERFYELIAEYNTVQSSRRTVDMIQEWIGCCGTMGILDYINWNMVVPNTCFDPITGNAWYRDGTGYVSCTIGFSEYIGKGTGWICGIALFLAFFQIFGMIATCCLMGIKKDFRSKSLGDLTTR